MCSCPPPGPRTASSWASATARCRSSVCSSIPRASPASTATTCSPTSWRSRGGQTSQQRRRDVQRPQCHCEERGDEAIPFGLIAECHEDKALTNLAGRNAGTHHRHSAEHFACSLDHRVNHL